MQKVIDRLKTLQARLQAMYLGMEAIMDQHAIMRYMRDMIKIRILLGEHKFKKSANLLQKLSDGLKDLAYGYRTKHGEALCSKIRRIATAIEALVPRVQNSESLNKIPKLGNSEQAMDYASIYSGFHDALADTLSTREIETEAYAIYRDMSLIKIYEADLLLYDRLAESLISENWFDTSIKYAIIDATQALYEAEQKIEDGAFKCRLYRAMSIARDFMEVVKNE